MAVELGVLRGLVDALYAMNIADDQLVEFFEDEDSYNLETVDDDDFDIEVVPVPRVVGLLTEDCRDAEWVRDTGERYRFDSQFGNWELVPNGSSEWVNARVDTPGRGGASFTEVLT